jgi:hypothetical protein
MGKQKTRQILDRTYMHEKYNPFIRDIQATRTEFSQKENDLNSFLIEPWIEPKTPGDLISVGGVWREVLETLNRHKNFVRINLMIVAEFSVDVEADAFDDNDTVMLGFRDNAYILSDVKLGLPIKGNLFHLPWDQDFYRRSHDLEIMGYLKKNQIWIPVSRILDIDLTLD